MLLKKLLKLLFVVSLFLGLNLSAKMTAKTIEQMPVFKQMNGKVLGFVEIGDTGIYKVRVQDQKSKVFEVAIDKSGEYLFLTNKIINTKTQKPITIPVDITPLKGKELFSYGDGKKILYIFTDPECPYCKNFEKLWPSLKDKYTFKVYLYNLPFHKNADAMSYYILSGGAKKSAGERLIEIANGDNKNWKEFKVSNKDKLKLDEILQNSKSLGSSIGVAGTPAVFDEDGNSVNWGTLK